VRSQLSRSLPRELASPHGRRRHEDRSRERLLLQLCNTIAMSGLSHARPSNRRHRAPWIRQPAFASVVIEIGPMIGWKTTVPERCSFSPTLILPSVKSSRIKLSSWQAARSAAYCRGASLTRGLSSPRRRPAAQRHGTDHGAKRHHSHTFLGKRGAMRLSPARRD